MINLQGALSVFKFELRRSISAGRICVWVVLVLFPPAIVQLMFMGSYPVTDPLFQFGLPLLILLPQVMCLLGQLLWASPLVHSELEGRSWIYVTTRPGGRLSLLLGKYVAAIAWTASACWTSLLLVMAVGMRAGVVEQPLRMFLVYAALIGFSTMGYGALFVFIGAIFHRRAMVVAVAYAVVSEFALTLVPAVVRQLTFAYHFRCLLKSWMGWSVSIPDLPIFGIEPDWQHVMTLIGMTLCLIIAAGIVVHNRQYITSEET